MTSSKKSKAQAVTISRDDLELTLRIEHERLKTAFNFLHEAHDYILIGLNPGVEGPLARWLTRLEEFLVEGKHD